MRGPNCQPEEDELEADDAEEGGAGGGAKAEEPQMSLADLMPKVDIRWAVKALRLSLFVSMVCIHMQSHELILLSFNYGDTCIYTYVWFVYYCTYCTCTYSTYVEYLVHIIWL